MSGRMFSLCTGFTMLRTLAVSNYRSLRDLVVPLGPLTVITGPNGSGKSSLYRALRLLAETAQGGLVAALAREGGLPSTLWAGPETVSRAMTKGRHPVQGSRRQSAVRLLLGFASDDLGYAVDLGLPVPVGSAFGLDPEIKRESIWSGPVLRPATTLVDRRGPNLRATDATGQWQSVAATLTPYDSMMTAFSDPRSAPEMLVLRERMRGWRFYDHLRTDPDAPARRPQVGTHTPVLSHDGYNLAAAIQTIREIGDRAALTEAIDDAFTGSTLGISASDGVFELTVQQSGLLRPLRAAELSDGTLRYIMLVAALLTARPPELLVFNEPESSLHPDLYPALARLIGRSAARSQLIVVSHSAALVSMLGQESGAGTHQLEKVLGETRLANTGLLDRPRWEWPAR